MINLTPTFWSVTQTLSPSHLVPADMNPTDREQLQACCHHQANFQQMQQSLLDNCERFQLEQYKALFRIIAKSRETLDLNAILQSVVEEVRQFLQADRVAVFRFYSHSNSAEGGFVSEAVLPGLHSVLAAKVQDYCFWEPYASQYKYGRVQAVSDIHSAGLQDCHTAVLEQFQIRANLVLPILQAENLWGLLCVHQCSAPRAWQPGEIEFAAQAASQMGIMLTQTELHLQTQQQTQALVETLKQLKQTQAQLVQHEKLVGLGQLVAGLAHEINNPVNFICGNLTHANRYAQQLIELLRLYQQEHISPSPELNTYLEKADPNFIVEDFPKLLASMEIGIDRIRQLVESLHNFSRMDEVKMQPTNLHEGIDSTLLILNHRLKPGANSRGIQVTCEYGDLPLVDCYATQIAQVFMNLISNAIDAVEEAMLANNVADQSQSYHPQIIIRTMQIPDPQGGNPRAVICIADNGIGIPFAIQEKLFDPFFTTKPLGKGTGLGLSTCREIVVDKHGGDLQCYSQPNKGTEFWIELPIKQYRTTLLSDNHAQLNQNQPTDCFDSDALLYKA